MYGGCKAIVEKDGSLRYRADDELKKIYDSIGIEYEEKENGEITVSSDIKRTTKKDIEQDSDERE